MEKEYTMEAFECELSEMDEMDSIESPAVIVGAWFFVVS